MSSGQRLASDAWLSKQPPWRIKDKNKLRKIEQVVEEERMWLEKPALPVFGSETMKCHSEESVVTDVIG